MATTDGQMALDAVDAAVQAGVGLAVIHGESELSRGAVSSDVDLVIDRPVHAFVTTVAAKWIDVGLWPLVVWPYDEGGTGTIFLSSADGGDGVQIDVLFDPRGRGQYGAKSDVMLAQSEPGIRFPRVAHRAAAAYLLSKRLSKGQYDRAASLIGSMDEDALELSLHDVLTEPVRIRVLRYLRGGEFHARRVRHVSRVLSRLTRPVGGWVVVSGGASGALARQLADRFGRFLPNVAMVEHVDWRSWLTSVAPIRWRAGLVFSTNEGTLPRSPNPDVTVMDAGDVAQAARQVVDEISSRHIVHRS